MPNTPKGTPTESKDEPSVVKAGPVDPIDRPQTRVEPDTLLVSDLTPQLAKDGQVYVSDAISEAAVAEGYAPDLQPRAHPEGDVPKLSEEEQAELAEKQAANAAALEAIQAPLSVKVERAVQGDDVVAVVETAKNDYEPVEETLVDVPK